MNKKRRSRYCSYRQRREKIKALLWILYACARVVLHLVDVLSRYYRHH